MSTVKINVTIEDQPIMQLPKKTANLIMQIGLPRVGDAMLLPPIKQPDGGQLSIHDLAVRNVHWDLQETGDITITIQLR